MAIVLIITTKDGQDIEVPLFGKFTIGRSSSSDLKIEDNQISGKHGYFDINPKGQVLYCDLDSTNGSYLNNSKIHNTIIKVNDVLKVGNTLIKIDSKKLTNKESIIIGKSKIEVNDNSNSDQPLALAKSLTPINPELNKNLKNLKKPIKQKNSFDRANEKLIEQEESSGLTKMLKLETAKGKKNN